MLQAVLFEPLNMTGAFVESGAALPRHRATGHQSYFGMQHTLAEPAPPRYLVPAGFAGASAQDLGRYGGMLVGGGSFGGKRILDRDVVAAILGPLEGPGQALGWGRRRIDGTLVVEHKGNARTTSARVRLVPQHGYAIVVLATTNLGPFFAATDDLMDGVHAILAGQPAPRLWPRERLFKAALLAGTLLSVATMLWQVRRWRNAGHPLRVSTTARTLARLAFDTGAAAFVCFGIPRLVGVPLTTMSQYFPDLGLALIVSAVAGAIGGALRAFTASARTDARFAGA